MKYLYHVDVAPGIHYNCLGDSELHLKQGDEVIVSCERYEDFGVVVECYDDKGVDEKEVQRQDSQSRRGRRVQGRRVPDVVRRATLADRGKAHENAARASSMRKAAVREIARHGLPMKIINSHVAFDKSLLILQFSAEGRVDFRDLLRDLSSQVNMRVELRQVGVRDEAAIQGGMGACGRVFCCASFMKKFTSINVRMAKEQGLSLNPNNISGACGRLKCCLRFENEGYRELRKTLPRTGSKCETPDGPGKIVDVNPLQQSVRVSLSNDRGRVNEYSVEDVHVAPSHSRRNSPQERSSSGSPAKKREGRGRRRRPSGTPADKR